MCALGWEEGGGWTHAYLRVCVHVFRSACTNTKAMAPAMRASELLATPCAQRFHSLPWVQKPGDVPLQQGWKALDPSLRRRYSTTARAQRQQAYEGEMAKVGCRAGTRMCGPLPVRAHG